MIHSSLTSKNHLEYTWYAVGVQQVCRNYELLVWFMKYVGSVRYMIWLMVIPGNTHKPAIESSDIKYGLLLGLSAIDNRTFSMNQS